MKLIHAADVHASHARINETIHILNQLIDRASAGDIDFVVFTGDFFDGTMTNTKASGFTDIVSLMKTLQNKCRVIMIYGTALHEPDGCLDVFKNDFCDVYGDCFGTDVFDNEAKLGDGGQTEFVIIPEPRRSRFIDRSAREVDDSIRNYIKENLARINADPRPDYMPRVVLYHGEIKGASYPNGVKATSPIGITVGQMKSLDADYYACGHIHLPQEPFKNCFYSGSAVPVDFNECHDGGYNIVTIERGETSVERVSFGFPHNLTLNLQHDEYVSLNKDFTNTNVKILVECSKAEAKKINTVSEASRIKEASHAASVTVELQAEQVTNIRSSEITKKRTNREKLEEYVKVNSLDVPKGAYEELQDIEDHQLIKYVYPVHSFTLEYVSVKGSIGIKDGTGKDEIEVDFSQYSPGVLVLLGHNGNGKTTLIEMCQPYPRMVTRTSVSFAENFFLKDSHKILIYSDENGLRYKITMLIDAHVKGGKILYFVETSKNNGKWERVPGVDGSLKSYSQYVDNTFGTIEVFLRTAFLAKEPTKSIPDIASATKGDRMELLASLYGSDYLTDISKAANAESKELSKNLADMKAEYGNISELESQVSDNKKSIKEKEKRLEEIEPELSEYKAKIKELEPKDREYKDYLVEEKQNRKLVDSYRKEISRLQSDVASNTIKIAAFKKYSDNRNRIEQMISEKVLMKSLSEKKESLNKERQKILEDMDAETKKINALKSDIDIKEGIARKIEFDINMEKSKYVEIGDTCPTCGEPLKPAVKSRLETLAKTHLGNAETLDITKTKIMDGLRGPKEKLETLNKEFAALEESKKSNENQSKVNEAECDEVSAKLELYSDIKEFLDTVPDEAMESDNDELKEQVNELEKKVSETSLPDPEDVSEELSEAKDIYAETNDEIHEIKAAIKTLGDDNEKKLEVINGQSEAKRSILSLEKRIKALDFVTTAFGNKGIQALELESSAPQIASIADRILSKSYGERFSIRFETLRQSKGKDIEDFNIMVYDSPSGREKALDLLCSGEKIWVKQALAYAFGIVRKNRTGFNFNTQFIDESDGSLDSDTRQKYYSMIKSAHNESGAVLTVLITHSTEIKDIAEQTLCLSD